jgi:hypothetical protein
MNNTKEMRSQLSKVFSAVKSGRIKPEVARELNRVAGTIINTVKAELKQAELRKEKPSIAFLSQ